ncbi:hypothetical protein AUJ42_03585 [Candidatus Collierbacteria bacterium CG1_02_44_10]|uniref:Schlafen AlbA-2 domain-containing protein n=1 Tax=Candidatus Collierbacteria bacterium CG1_02_44_10 TaxID=1805087 RepID=A0A1J4RW59_9BACT|nr:MAG: hypothetical protein AUJ42_03585 [Candidatus Collierbacteria bacterium CG1_02_44_10]
MYDKSTKNIIELLLKISAAFGITDSKTYIISDPFSSHYLANSSKEMISNLQSNNVDVLNKIHGVPDNSIDLIVASIPWLSNTIRWIDKQKHVDISLRKGWMILYQSLFKLKDTGTGLYAVEPSFWASEAGRKFRGELNRQGFYINFCFNTPIEYCYPMTKIKPNIVGISRAVTNKVFITSLELNSSLETIASSFKKMLSTTINEGVLVDKDMFLGFDRYNAQQELVALSKQYSNFKKIPLNRLVLDIKSKALTDLKDSVYLRLTGNFKAVSFDKVINKNYVQLIVDQEKVIPNYLSHYLNSELGQKILNSVSGGSVIPHLSKSDLMGIDVYIPELKLQKQILEVEKSIDTLTTKLDGFKNELAINPVSCLRIGEETDKLLKSLDLVGESDEVLSIIRNGETNVVEFKETLLRNVETGQKDKIMINMVLKTICGFLNTSGGTLLIGVKDDGAIPGIENDIYVNDDKYLKDFYNLFRDYIGLGKSTFVNWKIIRINRGILKISCAKSDDPVYLKLDKGTDDEKFYIRSNPATEELKGSKLVEYINKHFKKV